jgi:hypothetical protein
VPAGSRDGGLADARLAVDQRDHAVTVGGSPRGDTELCQLVDALEQSRCHLMIVRRFARAGNALTRAASTARPASAARRQ